MIYNNTFIYASYFGIGIFYTFIQIIYAQRSYLFILKLFYALCTIYNQDSFTDMHISWCIYNFVLDLSLFRYLLFLFLMTSFNIYWI